MTPFTTIMVRDFGVYGVKTTRLISGMAIYQYCNELKINIKIRLFTNRTPKPDVHQMHVGGDFHPSTKATPSGQQSYLFTNLYQKRMTNLPSYKPIKAIGFNALKKGECET